MNIELHFMENVPNGSVEASAIRMNIYLIEINSSLIN